MEKLIWPASKQEIKKIEQINDELLDACKDMAQAYSDNISIMPVFLQTYIDKIEQAIKKAEEDK